MRVAQVAPLYESVPPKGYGGTERIVSFLTEELVFQGHDVTLFASGDSMTRARLVSPCRKALRGDGGYTDPLVYHVLLLESLLRQAEGFDVVHFHCDVLHLPWARRLAVPSLTTLHGRADLPAVADLFRVFHDVPLVSISDAQREPLPDLPWLGTVYHGLPSDRYRLVPRSEDPYLAVLGRVSPEKGVDRAIAIAAGAGMPVRIAAKVDPLDAAYFAERIQPLLSLPGVEYLGEINELEKQRFLGNALALLFPVDWPEPFGIVMIEAMACGTPVIAFRRGSVPEVLDDGVTGYIVDGVDEAIAAVARVGALSRRGCRAAFERRFTARRMADDYLALYRTLVDRAEQGWAESAGGPQRVA